MKKKLLSVKNVVSALFIFLMVSSVFGVIFYGYAGSVQKEKVNGITFTLTKDGVRASIEDKPFLFQYFPKDVEDIPLSAGAHQLLASQALAVTYPPNASAYREMALLQLQLWEFFQSDRGVYVLTAVTEPQDNLPVVTCANTTALFPVIEIREGNTTQVRDENNCIIIEADAGYQYDRLYDRIRYDVLGIIHG